jgi:hypothetical protein
VIFLKKQNLLFIKSVKTAGTSVEIALSANATPQDIVTPLLPGDELLRMKEPYQFPVNWAQADKFETAHYVRMQALKALDLRADDPDLYQGVISAEQNRFFNHMRPGAIRSQLGAETFDKAHKISIVRDPYEQLISAAYFNFRAIRDDLTLEQMIDKALTSKTTNVEWFFIDGQCIIDTFLKYETLKEDLGKLEERFSLSLVEYLPEAKSHFRTNHTPARQLLSLDQKKKCYERNRLEFEMFGYDKDF